jgi:hypothetical protein
MTCTAQQFKTSVSGLYLFKEKKFQQLYSRADRCHRWLCYLRYKAIQIGVVGPLNVQRAPADVIDGLIVEQDGDISMLQERVGGEHTVVGLNNRG